MAIFPIAEQNGGYLRALVFHQRSVNRRMAAPSRIFIHDRLHRRRTLLPPTERARLPLGGRSLDLRRASPASGRGY